MADTHHHRPAGPELEMNQREHLVKEVQVPGEAHHAEPSALGLAPGGWVGLSMLAFLLILVWKKVPGMLVGGLDAKIAEIRQQLDEAKALRAAAEALRKEYADKIAGAENRIAEIKAKALADVGSIAEETTAAVVEQLIGTKATKAEIASAVKSAAGE